MLLLQEENFDVLLCVSHPDEIRLARGDDSENLLILLCEERLSPELSDALSMLRRTYPRSRIVLLLQDYDSAARERAERLGADGLLSKCISRHVLMRSIELIMLGEHVFSSTPGVPARAVLEERRVSAAAQPLPLETQRARPRHDAVAAGRPGPVMPRAGDRKGGSGFERAGTHPWIDASAKELSERRDTLSGRETEILLCLVDGLSNKMIARQCGITDATVKVHLKAILRKIKVQNRTQAAVWAMQKIGAGHLAAHGDGKAPMDEADHGDYADGHETDDHPAALSTGRRLREMAPMAQMPPQVHSDHDYYKDHRPSGIETLSTD
ncbi:response regulator transcription factor [Fulvimarina sp. 2208YS6-2-32]|uniref:Response regulator transcription factor n=1 Tax=Fulvimarina uroteuthidis TaxID=3098149 RepID=A0ABU5I0B0_9HYPH|nr:response regulator transcription factor [Fulvimarina sp. 2208YS6-2-32]MDY8108787.1 response regulator transcription factor [Fulvimarina sp. 2208YS6-2-32]